MDFIADNLVLLPIATPLVGAMAALLLGRFPRARAYWSLGVMLLSLVFSLLLLWRVTASGAAVVMQAGGWGFPYGISLVGDPLSALFAVMAQLVLALGLLYSLGSKDAVITYRPFYPLFLLLGTGLTGAFLTGDLFNLFVFAELLVISGTALTAASDDRFGTEAAYKYFYMSLLASTFMLLAIGSLYVSYGTLNLADLAARIADKPDGILLAPAVALLLATFMIKSAVFPFHFWQPDFHAAAPTAVSAMLSSVVVKVGVYGFLRILLPIFPNEMQIMLTPLLWLAVATIVFSAWAAMMQKDLKRIVAYSSINHLGYCLLGVFAVASFTGSDPKWTTEKAAALNGVIVQMFNHGITASALFYFVGLIEQRAGVGAHPGDVLHRGRLAQLLVVDRRLRRVARLVPCLLYPSPSPRDRTSSRMPSSP